MKKSMAKYNPKSTILCDLIEPNEAVKDATDMKALVVKDEQISFSDVYFK